MSAVACRAAITGVLQTYTGNPPIIGENLPGGAEGTEWARWSIRMADAFDADVGGNFERMIGKVFFQHFMPENRGTKEAWDFADKIGALLNGKITAFASGTGRIIFSRAVCMYIGIVDGSVQHNIVIDWQEDAKALNAA